MQAEILHFVVLKERMKKGRLHPVLWAALFCLMLILYSIPAYLLRPDLAKSGDDASYISHAFTLGLDFDLDYSNEISSVELLYHSRNSLFPSHPIGSGILAAPFVALFGIIDRVEGSPVIHDRSQYRYSWSYFGFLFASGLSFIFGLLLYLTSLKKIYPYLNPRMIVLFCISSGILYYSIGHFSVSHGFEFFGCAVLFYSSVALGMAGVSGIRLYAKTAGLGFAVLINLLIRYSNIGSLLLPFIVLAFLSLIGRYTPRWSDILRIGISIVLFLLPYVAFSLHFYGNPFPTYDGVYSVQLHEFSYGSAFVIALRSLGFLPVIFFGSEFGLLWSFPVLVLGVLAIIASAITRWKDRLKRTSAVFTIVISVLYCGIPFGIVLFWRSVASDYGFRYLLCLMPLALLGVSWGWDRLSGIKNTAVRIARAAVIGLLVYASLSAFFFRATPALKPKAQINSFGIMTTYGSKGYQIAVLKSFFDPGSWAMALGKSLLSVPAADFIENGNRFEWLIPEDFRKKFLPYFNSIPLAIYLQYLVLLITWAVAGAWICRIANRMERNRGKDMQYARYKRVAEKRIGNETYYSDPLLQ